MDNWVKIKHDLNGNPRYVVSWLGHGFDSYEQALRAAKRIGGKRFHNRQFGGGIVFQAYECELKGIDYMLARSADESRNMAQLMEAS